MHFCHKSCLSVSNPRKTAFSLDEQEAFSITTTLETAVFELNLIQTLPK